MVGRPPIARVAGAAALLAAAFLLAGCGTGGRAKASGNTNDGKQMFVQKCGSCHALEDAGTTGTTGPDLDDAFFAVREDGWEESTIRDVVLGQMRFPNPPMPGPQVMFPSCRGEDEPSGCSENRDEDMQDVAAYIAQVAANPTTSPGTPTGAGTTTEGGGAATGGEAIFKQYCGSCHTLAAAGTTGTVGPNLDESKPSLQLAIDRVTHGRGAMPAFKGQLTDEQIRAVAEYVASGAGR